MGIAKTQVEPGAAKSMQGPAYEKQQSVPEQLGGPLRTQRTASSLPSVNGSPPPARAVGMMDDNAEAPPGPARARMSIAVQRKMGNTRMGQMVAASPQVTPSVDTSAERGVQAVRIQRKLRGPVARLGPSALMRTPAAWTYDPGQRIRADDQIPYGHTFQASPGEQIIFDGTYVDKDRKRLGSGAWQLINGEGPYLIIFTASAGSFIHRGSMQRSWSIFRTGGTATIATDNINFFLDNSWRGTPVVRVTVQVFDFAAAKSTPHMGHTKDPAYRHTWTITARARACPKWMSLVGGRHGAPVSNPATWTYRMEPLLTPPGMRPCYHGQSLLETFDPPIPLFTMSDLTAAWKKSNPGLKTPQQVVKALYGDQQLGTFVIDNRDEITDQYGDWSIMTPFTPAARAAGVKVGWIQAFTCGSSTVGEFTTIYENKGGVVKWTMRPGRRSVTPPPPRRRASTRPTPRPAPPPPRHRGRTCPTCPGP